MTSITTPTPFSLLLDASHSTSEVQEGIDQAKEEGLDVYFNKVHVDKPLTFDPAGRYFGAGRVAQLRYRVGEPAHITSSYAGVDPAFQVKPDSNYPVAVSPHFQNLVLDRNNLAGTALELRDVQNGRFDNLSIYGGAVTLDVVSEKTGSWYNQFLGLTLNGGNTADGSIKLRLRQTEKVGTNENWFFGALLHGGEQSLVIEEGSQNKFTSVAIARAATPAGKPSIDLQGGKTVFTDVRVEQNYIEPGAFVLSNEGDLRWKGGSIYSKRVNSTARYIGSGTITAGMVRAMPLSVPQVI